MVEKIKRASWLELFYDLAFVALVAQLTYIVSEQLDSITHLIYAILLSYMIFIAWFGTTVSRNMQDEERVGDKLIVQLQMIIAFTLSIFLHNVYEGEYTLFFLLFALLRAIQVFSILRMYRIHPEYEPKTKNVVQGYTVGIMLWVLAALSSGTYTLIIAFMALAMDIFTPLTKGKGNAVRYLDVAHLKERLGLFLLLVIGESMLVVALSSTAAVTSIDQPIIIISGFIYMTALWWIYYSRLEHYMYCRPKNMFVYLESHVVLFASVMMLAAAYRNFISTSAFTTIDLALLFGSSILLLITQFTIDYGLRKNSDTRWLRTLVVGIFGFVFAWYIGFYFDSLYISVLGSSLWLVVMAIYNELLLEKETPPVRTV